MKQDALKDIKAIDKTNLLSSSKRFFAKYGYYPTESQFGAHLRVKDPDSFTKAALSAIEPDGSNRQEIMNEIRIFTGKNPDQSATEYSPNKAETTQKEPVETDPEAAKKPFYDTMDGVRSGIISKKAAFSRINKMVKSGIVSPDEFNAFKEEVGDAKTPQIPVENFQGETYQPDGDIATLEDAQQANEGLHELSNHFSSDNLTPQEEAHAEAAIAEANADTLPAIKTGLPNVDKNIQKRVWKKSGIPTPTTPPQEEAEPQVLPERGEPLAAPIQVASPETQPKQEEAPDMAEPDHPVPANPTFSKCAEIASTLSEGAISQEGAQAVVDEMKPSQPNTVDSSAASEAIKNRLNALVQKQQEESIQRARLAKTANDDADEMVRQSENGITHGYALSAKASQIELGVKGAHASAENMVSSRIGQWAGAVRGDLTTDEANALGARQMLKSGDYDGKLANLILELENKGKMTAPTDDTGKGLALAAHSLFKSKERMIQTMRAYGVNVQRSTSHVARMFHDPNLIRASSAKDWSDFTRPLLKKSALDDGDLFKAYDAITGVHVPDAIGARADNAGIASLYQRNRNIRATMEKKLVFKDGDAWDTYNKRYGAGTLEAAFTHQMMSNAFDLANHETFGRSIPAFWREVGKQREAEGRPLSNEDWNMIATTMDAYLKVDKIPVNATLDDITHILSDATTAVKIPAVMPLAFASDVVTSVIAHNNDGIPVGEAAWNQISATIKDIAKKSNQSEERVANSIGAGIDGFLGNHSRLSAMGGSRIAQGRTGLRNLSAKLAHAAMKWSLLEGWTNSVQRASTVVLSRDLGFHADKKFSELPRDLKTMFLRHTIDGKDWDNIRASAWDGEGNKYITPDAVYDHMISKIDPEDAKLALTMEYQLHGVKNVHETSLALPARRLEQKVLNMMHERMKAAIPTPTARDTRWLSGAKSGTPWGMMVRLFMLFKHYPISILNRSLIGGVRNSTHLGFFQALTRKEQMLPSAWKLSKYIGGMWLAGYLSDRIYDMLHPDQQDPNATEVDKITSAFANSGLLGIYSNYLSSYAQRNEIGAIGGPLLGTLANTFITGSGILYNPNKDVGDKLTEEAQLGTRFIAHNAIPVFGTMWYTQALIARATAAYFAQNADAIQGWNRWI